MREMFDSANRLRILRNKLEDEDVTLSREQVLFLFDYIEALEVTLNLVAEDDSNETDDSDAHVLIPYLEEAIESLPKLEGI